MTKYLVITIDVEPDCTPTWHYSSPLEFRGVSQGIAEILHPLFNKYDVAPTYLLNNVVLEDPESCKVLQGLDGRFELGTHLHPEFIEPEKTQFDYAGKRGAANCCEYAPDIEFEKLAAITKLFRNNLGYSPTSFRAGRFSAGKNTINSLARLGYLADTSVTPRVLWGGSSRRTPIDYTQCAEQPYWTSHHSYPEGDIRGQILEVPVSISTKPTNFLKEMRRTWFLTKRPYKAKQASWLRPAYSSYEDFVKLTHDYVRRYSGKENLVFNMMFHNVEVLPALSPYTLTEEACQQYLSSLDRYFSFCQAEGFQFITLSETVGLMPPRSNRVEETSVEYRR